MSYIIFSSNRENSLKFADLIYKDASIYLQYKHETCYRKVEKTLTANDVYGNCIYCNGKNIWRQSTRYTKHGIMRRLYCLDCKKRYQKPFAE